MCAANIRQSRGLCGVMEICIFVPCVRFLSALTAFARSQSACGTGGRFSLLDLFVGARTLTRSQRGSGRLTASRDKSAAPLSAGGVRGSRCNLGSQIQIYDSSHGRDTGAG